MKIAKTLEEKINAAIVEGKPSHQFRVFVKFEGNFQDLQIGDMPLHPTLSGPARGWLTPEQINVLKDLEEIIIIDEPVDSYLNLDNTVPHIKANLVWVLGPPQGLKGNGVVVAVIDSGIDVLHESFQDSSGNTRILALWDQTFRYDSTSGIAVDKNGAALAGTGIPTDEDGNVLSVASNRTPSAHTTMAGNAVDPGLAAMDFGVEFTRAQIDTALTKHRNNGQAIPISLRDDPESHNHGTHVAGIAAGDGSQSGNCRGENTFVGVAPEADLIIIKIGFTNDRVQDVSAATEYALVKARTAGLPVSINLSLGSNFGAHNGFDDGAEEVKNLLTGSQGEVIVYAAGNERNDATHMAASISVGNTFSFDFFVNRGVSVSNFWMSFPFISDFEYTLLLPQPSSGPRSTVPAIDITDENVVTNNGHSFNPSIKLGNLGDPDSHASLSIVNSAPGGFVAAGIWRMTINNKSAFDLNLHIWSAKNTTNFIIPASLPASTQNPNQPENWLKATLGTTAMGSEVLAVGAYDIGSGSPVIAPFSSQGPAPLGLDAGLYPAGSPQKPDIAAPGVGITSAKAEAFDCFLMCECCVNNYLDMQGTSQAAPHIAGVAALMLQADPTLTHTQIKALLQGNAQAAPPLDSGWPPSVELFGAGTVDAKATVEEVIANLGTPRIAATEVARSAAQALHPPLFSRAAQALRSWEARFGARPAWHFFAGMVSRHFVEVQRLINTQKKVGAVWQRHGGPALIRTIVFGERDIDPPIPEKLGKKRMDVLIERLLPVLHRFGGPELTADLKRYDKLARNLPGKRVGDLDAMIKGLST